MNPTVANIVEQARMAYLALSGAGTTGTCEGPLTT